eukprot:scaffold7340_cov266-Pinguiococcus_pyrenoidosus.AAC.45
MKSVAMSDKAANSEMENARKQEEVDEEATPPTFKLVFVSLAKRRTKLVPKPASYVELQEAFARHFPAQDGPLSVELEDGKIILVPRQCHAKKRRHVADTKAFRKGT